MPSSSNSLRTAQGGPLPIPSLPPLVPISHLSFMRVVVVTSRVFLTASRSCADEVNAVNRGEGQRRASSSPAAPLF
eukprot:2983356-Pyramimonas_sp.AAC.2